MTNPPPPPPPLVEPVARVEPVETSHSETPFTILVVCTGNICRSPLAEQLLRARLAAHGVPVTLLSAGTYAMVGQAMTPEAAALSVRYGGDPAGHAPRQLTADLVAGADLVLTAGREHRSEVISLHPRASRYAFTLNQFARLIAATPALVEPTPLVEPVETTLPAYIADIAASRGLTPPPPHASDDDIEDPYRRSDAVYDRSGAAIDAAVTTIVSGFATALGKR